MKKNLIFARIMEYSWLTIFLSTTFTCIHTFHYYGVTKDFLVFGCMALMSLGMYFYRKNRSKKMSQEQ